LCGDVNAFFHPWLPAKTAELEVMVAEEQSRHKGIAREALLLLMSFLRDAYHIHHFVAKIGATNIASLTLFQQHLHFTIKEYIEAFDEYELIAPPCTCDQCSQVQSI